MSNSKRTVLITGCSDGGLGSALAKAFHKVGLHVIATARDPAKMTDLAALGIETLPLDVQSEASIASAVGKLSSLDILVNNAGAQFLMPLADVNITAAKRVYDLNVWSYIAMTQACLPLLLESPNAVIANQTSIGASMAMPFQAVYNSSKAAMAMLTDSLRLELQPFDVKVVDLRTGVVLSNLINNLQQTSNVHLPAGSIYEPAKEVVEKALRQDVYVGQGLPADKWAALVVQDLLKRSPPSVVWRGDSAGLTRAVAMLPTGTMDGTIKKMAGLDTAEKIIREARK